MYASHIIGNVTIPDQYDSENGELHILSQTALKNVKWLTGKEIELRPFLNKSDLIIDNTCTMVKG